MDESLDTTLDSASRGDQRAWRLIVAEFAPRVFAIVRARCGDAELAEEITQSVFCTLAGKITGGDGYEEQGRFEAWVFRIAMNRLRDEMRRRKRQAVTVDHEVLQDRLGSMTDSALQEAEDGEMMAALRVVIAQLSPADREVIEYRHVAGLSFRQIAEIVDEPLGTILARQHRALAKLRKMLGEKVGSIQDHEGA